jgi:hypothetical protein
VGRPRKATDESIIAVSGRYNTRRSLRTAERPPIRPVSKSDQSSQMRGTGSPSARRRGNKVNIDALLPFYAELAET